MSTLESKLDEALARIAFKTADSAERLTEIQMAQALRQALGDFETHVTAEGQQVTYVPGRQAAKWRRLYDQLIFAVCTKHPGETRHETALRYINEAEERRTTSGAECEASPTAQ